MKVKFADDTVMVGGYVPADAEKKSTSEKAPWKFSVKVGEKPLQEGQERPDASWCSCASWHSSAAAIRKGDIVLAFGKLVSNVGSDGKTYWTLNVDGFVICNKAAAAAVPAVAAASDFDGFEEVSDGDGKLPF